MNFDEKKATQIAGYFLQTAGGRMPYIKLIKLVYLADRTALLQWHTTLTHDRYYSLPHGPIGSNTKNLATDDHDLDAEPSYWRQFISKPEEYDVRLISEPQRDALSRAELRLLAEIFETYGPMDKWRLRDFTHTLPEYHDPKGGSINISLMEILQSGGFDETAAEAITDELTGMERIRDLVAV